MSDKKQAKGNAIEAAQITMGAINELARRGGQDVLGPGGVTGSMKNGASLIKGAATVAPAAVAAVSAKTVAGIAAAKVVAVAAAPVAVVGLAGYGVYRFLKWSGEQ